MLRSLDNADKFHPGDNQVDTTIYITFRGPKLWLYKALYRLTLFLTKNINSVQ